MLTRADVATHIEDYLKHRITVDQMVNWAEESLMEGEVAADDAALLARILGRLGLADVRAFGLTWDDCRGLLSDLGYEARLELRKIA
jgi:hypothetical protein